MNESYTYMPTLPDIVDAPHPYIGLGDLLDISKRFDPTVSASDTAPLQDELFNIQQLIVPDEASFIATPANALAERLGCVAFQETQRSDTHVGVVIIDRYIAPQAVHPSFFRLNASRDSTSQQIERPGVPVGLDNQYNSLKEWCEYHDFDEVVLMDDALGTGSTFIMTINKLRHELPHQRLRVFAGIATTGGETWSGVEKVYKATGIMPEYLTLQKASEQTESSTGLSICNSRDMTLFGGYLQPGSGNPRLSSPHFLPYTVTVPKNFTAPYYRVVAAELLLDFSDRFVDFLEQRAQRPLVMQDCSDKGFGFPATTVDSIHEYLPEPSPRTLIKDHLTQSRDVFVRHRPRLILAASAIQRSRNHG
jgi:hypothetical protein